MNIIIRKLQKLPLTQNRFIPNFLDHSVTSRYRLKLNIAGSTRNLSFLDKEAKEAATVWDWRPLKRAIKYKFPSATDRLMVGSAPIEVSELPDDAQWPPFIALDLSPPKGQFEQKCALVVRQIDRTGAVIFSRPIRLNQPRTLFVPMSGSVVGMLFHIRLAGAGVLPPLKLKLSVPSQESVSGSVFASHRTRSGDAEMPASRLQESIVEAQQNRFVWTDILNRGTLDEKSFVMGVLDEQSWQGSNELRQLAVDESLEQHHLLSCTEYVFDARITDQRFGWEGVMSASNQTANAALIEHLSSCRKFGIKSKLIFDEKVRVRPYFGAISDMFDETEDPSAPPQADEQGLDTTDAESAPTANA